MVEVTRGDAFRCMPEPSEMAYGFCGQGGMGRRAIRIRHLCHGVLVIALSVQSAGLLFARPDAGRVAYGSACGDGAGSNAATGGIRVSGIRA